VQFKAYYLGEETPPNPRLVSCQKCFRTTDIEVVGDISHLTFFEMLGKFSIGDYFKREAIAWGWEFCTVRLGLDPERLWATVFLDDDESFGYWREIGLPESKIRRFGEKDNYWGPAGNSGPCGPCSEIHYDLGEELGCGQPACGPNCDCGRFSEIWNLVFTQYNQDESGNRTPLPNPNIDTGMGLERTVAVVTGKSSVYDTGLFTPQLECIAGLSAKKYGDDEATDHAMRVAVEHGRAVTFLIADGVIPANDGRGYVLRRLLRRGALFGRRLGLRKPFLAEIARVTVGQMGHAYPELREREEFILKAIRLEEARFEETLSIGLEVIDSLLDYRGTHRGVIPELMLFLRNVKHGPENTANILEEHGFVGGGRGAGRQIGSEIAAETISQLTHGFLKRLKEGNKQFAEDIMDDIENWGHNISGYEAFKLYDTYGFPVELTREIAGERGFSVDTAGFEREMAQQKEKARASHRFELAERGLANLKKELDLKASEFVGYDHLSHRSTLAALVVDNQPVKTVREGQEVDLILESTPFYAEMGGQVGDTGKIDGASGQFLVIDTVHVPPDIIVHQGRVVRGELAVGGEVTAAVDSERRLDIARNHTATHLLHYALRQVLGDHAQQRGSLVGPERFSFDFSHLSAVTPPELEQVQRIVNDKIRRNLPVYDAEMPYKEAVKEGAIALFDEKYGDKVRVLRTGRPPISVELCGGTHASATGEIGFLHVLSEHGIGAGLRRIEAVTGRGAEEFIRRRLAGLQNIAGIVGTDVENARDRVESLAAELKNERRQRENLEKVMARTRAEALLDQVAVTGDVNLLVAAVPASRMEILREMADFLRTRLKSGVIVLGSVYQDKPVFLAAVSADLVSRGYHAGNIVSQVARVTGGGGGGRPDLAQAGGRHKDKLDEALNLVKSLVEKT
ncbi:MAG: alanine--tRNA ligase, partial [Dehalococcoidales bacterium]